MMGKFFEDSKIKTKGDILGYGSNHESNIMFLDNCVESNDIQQLKPEWQDIDPNELMNDIFLEIIKVDRMYAQRKPVFPEWLIVKHDSECEVITGPDDENSSVVLCAFVDGWHKHWGGELIWYSEGEPEVTLATHSGRVIVSSGPTPIRLVNPTVDAQEELLYFTFRLKG